jgi:hypothetical protein
LRACALATAGASTCAPTWCGTGFDETHALRDLLNMNYNLNMTFAVMTYFYFSMLSCYNIVIHIIHAVFITIM